MVRANRTGPSDAAKLKERIRDLRTVLSIVGKCVSQGHYEAVVRYSTSMESIFKTLRCDYDIQLKGIHFLNILDVKYDSSKQTPIASQSCPGPQSSRDSLSEFLLLLQATHYTINYPTQHRVTLITVCHRATQGSRV